LGVYVPRSVDWHPALWCIISLLLRITDGNQVAPGVAPLTREHPRRRYTPVDTPWVHEHVFNIKTPVPHRATISQVRVLGKLPNKAAK
jgi:hypothetical protein